jgi:hypothetical protein
MGFFDSIFNKQNKIDEKLNKINLLSCTGRQNEANDETVLLVRELMNNTSILNDLKNNGDFGNFLTNQFDLFQNSNELQFITEIAFYSTTKELQTKQNLNLFYDRLIILYNAEDFITETIIECNNIQTNSLSRINSRHHIKWMADDMLLKMRFHDLFNKNKYYANGMNSNSFNGQEYMDFLNRIDQGSFESSNPLEIVSEGSRIITKCFNHISRKYNI